MSSLSDLLDRPIAFQRAFVRLGAGVTGALMLSQAVYWARRTADPDGWFFKTQADWEAETGLSRREQDTARKALGVSGVLEVQLRGVPATLHYRVSFGALEAALLGRPEQTSLAESAKLDWREAPNKNGGKRQTLTETTPETTPETIPENKALFDAEDSANRSGEPKQQRARKAPKAAEQTFDAWLDSLDDSDAIPAGDPIFGYMAAAGIPEDWHSLAWLSFCERFEGSPKTYADWRAAFRNYVRQGWLDVWRAYDGQYRLTTKGEQLRRVRDAQAVDA